MSVGVKFKPPVKNPQLSAEYPEGMAYEAPHFVYEEWLSEALSDM